MIVSVHLNCKRSIEIKAKCVTNWGPTIRIPDYLKPCDSIIKRILRNRHRILDLAKFINKINLFDLFVEYQGSLANQL